MDTSQAQVWINKAALYEILALSFRCPGDELLDALLCGEYAEAFSEIAALTGMATHVDCQVNSGDDRADERLVALAEAFAAYEGQDKTELLHTLRIEHTRLYVGSLAPIISPYAGIWYAEEAGIEPLLFVNKESLAVERIYRSIGVGQPQGTNEPLDYIATELEFLHYLCLLKAGAVVPPEGITVPDDLYESFFAEHFSEWSRKFAQKTIEQTRQPFFKACAQVLFAITP